MFFRCIVLPDSKDTELASSNQEASPSVSKNTGVFSTAISVDVDISEVPGYHLF